MVKKRKNVQQHKTEAERTETIKDLASQVAKIMDGQTMDVVAEVMCVHLAFCFLNTKDAESGLSFLSQVASTIVGHATGIESLMPNKEDLIH